MCILKRFALHLAGIQFVVRSRRIVIETIHRESKHTHHDKYTINEVIVTLDLPGDNAGLTHNQDIGINVLSWLMRYLRESGGIVEFLFNEIVCYLYAPLKKCRMQEGVTQSRK